MSAPLVGRSRKGAWIEMYYIRREIREAGRRSRKGAWIEIYFDLENAVVPGCRSRKGAWIEIEIDGHACGGLAVSLP